MNNDINKIVITFLDREQEEESNSLSYRDTFIIEFYDNKYDKVMEEVGKVENYKELKKLVDNEIIISIEQVLSYVVEDEKIL